MIMAASSVSSFYLADKTIFNYSRQSIILFIQLGSFTHILVIWKTHAFEDFV